MAKREQSGCGGARAAAAAAAREQVCGVVERVSYHDEASQFTVARLRCDEGGASSERAVGGGGGGGGARAAVTIVGRMPALQEGEWVQCEGRFVDDPQWGRQFQVTSCEVASPTTAHGIQRYLGSGLVKGVGPELARRIVERFGERTLQVLETEPERLREVEGIGRKRQRQLIEAWNEHRALRRIMVFLRGHGIGAAHAMRVWRSYGEAAIERVRENPYRLAAEIWGIGFGTADRLARALGVPADAPARAEAGLRHALERAADEGHVCVPRQELLVRATELLGVGTEGLEQALDRLVAAGAVRQEAPGSSGPHVYLCHLHAAECGLAERLAALQRAPSALPPIRVPEAIAWVEQRRGVVLAPSQRHALALALGSKVCVVTGGPGVGKTTIVACLLEIVRAKRGRVRLAAPTGRAAKRLQEATGHEAMTVHRLLRWNPRARDFEYGPEHPLPDCDLLVLDETSMVDVLLMHRLLLALPAAAHLVLVGDRDQLPSVGPGSVLADIIASGAVPVARLTEVHRQAAGSAIVAGAHAVNRGELPALRELGAGADLCFVEAGRPELALAAICDLVARVLPGRFGLDPVRDIQVLAPMHRGACGVQAINERLGEVLRPAGAAGGGGGRAGDRAAGTALRPRHQGHPAPQRLRPRRVQRRHRGGGTGGPRTGRAGGGVRRSAPALRRLRSRSARPGVRGLDPQEPGQRVSLRGGAAADAALHDAAAQSALHGDHARAAAGGAGGPAAGGRDRGAQRPHAAPRLVPRRAAGGGRGGGTRPGGRRGRAGTSRAGGGRGWGRAMTRWCASCAVSGRRII
ncbi:MAG: hypothetical protein KatS3mg102_0620 [Planctomycetota bacterium]|nr:MAG: hypothetical protein KatS3mg102_0620 [Planctomycetota bacterium]